MFRRFKSKKIKIKKEANMCRKQKNIEQDKKQDVIADLLQEARQNQTQTCISLTGKWGVGKTYRWNKDIKNHFAKNEVVYLSGFGKTELSEFKLELLDKLLKAKGWWSKFLTGLLITGISVFIIGGVVFNITGEVEDRHWFWITLGVIAGVSLLGTIFYYTSLVKYFSNKILGVDHNNIDFEHIWKSKNKPILCFDDLERSSFDDANCNILSFIEELKKQGYPVLLILNPDSKHSEFWQKFKEKVVTRTFVQLPTKETFDKVISKEEYQQLDDVEKAYLEEIFGLWSKTVKNKELVNENDFEIIFEQIKSDYLKQLLIIFFL